MSLLSRAPRRRAVGSGRSAVGAVVVTARAHLQKAFLAFVVGLFATVYAMRLWVWSFLRDVTTRGMSTATADELDIVVRTPFDVILLQMKLGMAVGVACAAVVVLYYARSHLAAADLWPRVGLRRRTLVAIAVLAAGLFLGGVAYGYYVFFPVMFAFLTEYALGAGFAPTYDLVKWTEFILLLTLSFGLAAQLPLAMTGLAALEIVPYETFREKWRHAVVGIFVFGAVFSPPDPFTQLMWALPLVALYGISLGLTRVVVTVSRSAQSLDVRGALWAARYRLVGAPVVVFIAAGTLGHTETAMGALAALGEAVPSLVPVGDAIVVASGGTVESAVLVVAGMLALSVALVVAVQALFVAVAAVDPRVAQLDVRDLDLASLDAEMVRTLPLRSFRRLGGREMLATVKTATRSGDRELAEAILERYDEARDAGYTPAPKPKSRRKSRRESVEDGIATYGQRAKRGTAGFASAWGDDEVTEDDIGGYLDDLLALVDTLRSKATYIIGAFGLGMMGAFAALYGGGVGMLKADFLARVPESAVPAEAVRIVALHPVEILVFAVQVSLLVGIMAAVPVVVFFLWPALADRGLVPTKSRVLRLWGVAVGGSVIAGSVAGYLFVAPTVISYLAWDAIRAGVVISYRVDAFFWLVFLTTAFVGLLAAVPTAMYLLGRGGVLGYETMREGWRVAVIALFVLAAVATPKGAVSMVVVATPLALSYLVGLAVLYVDRALRGLRRPPRARRTAP